MEKSKKLCSLIILLCGFMLIIAGIIVLTSSENHCGVSHSGLSRASTEIKFGADYYTTMAQYTALNANSAVDIYKLIKTCFGITFIFAGLVTSLLNLPYALEIVNSKNRTDFNGAMPVDAPAVENENLNQESDIL